MAERKVTLEDLLAQTREQGAENRHRMWQEEIDARRSRDVDAEVENTEEPSITQYSDDSGRFHVEYYNSKGKLRKVGLQHLNDKTIQNETGMTGTTWTMKHAYSAIRQLKQYGVEPSDNRPAAIVDGVGRRLEFTSTSDLDNNPENIQNIASRMMGTFGEAVEDARFPAMNHMVAGLSPRRLENDPRIVLTTSNIDVENHLGKIKKSRVEKGNTYLESEKGDNPYSVAKMVNQQIDNYRYNRGFTTVGVEGKPRLFTTGSHPVTPKDISDWDQLIISDVEIPTVEAQFVNKDHWDEPNKRINVELPLPPRSLHEKGPNIWDGVEPEQFDDVARELVTAYANALGLEPMKLTVNGESVLIGNEMDHIDTKDITVIFSNRNSYDSKTVSLNGNSTNLSPEGIARVAGNQEFNLNADAMTLYHEPTGVHMIMPHREDGARASYEETVEVAAEFVENIRTEQARILSEAGVEPVTFEVRDNLYTSEQRQAGIAAAGSFADEYARAEEVARATKAKHDAQNLAESIEEIGGVVNEHGVEVPNNELGEALEDLNESKDLQK